MEEIIKSSFSIKQERKLRIEGLALVRKMFRTESYPKVDYIKMLTTQITELKRLNYDTSKFELELNELNGE